MTGRRNRAQAPRGSSPRAPLFHWLFIWIKKWDSEIFLLQRTATKFGANIIWLLFYLFVKSSCLRGQSAKALNFCYPISLSRGAFNLRGGGNCLKTVG